MPDSAHNLLPIRFAPEADELFSSWLMRLAMAHILKLHSFSRFIFPEKQVWNRDIDKSAGDEHVRLICERTGLPFQRVFAATLRAFEGGLYETHNPNGNNSWILPVGVHRLTRTGFGLQMCPLCLSEDEEPYFRRRWRLSLTTLCSEHKVILLDRCPGCRSPVLFHRGDMGWRNQAVSVSMVQCSVCSLIWTSKKVVGSLRPAAPDAVAFQRKLENALIDKWCQIPGFGMVHSINFFNGLKHILRVLSVSRRSERFRQGAGSKFGMPLGEIEFAGNRIRSFDYLPLESRYRTLRIAAKLLSGWHEKFIEIALAADTFSSAFLPYDQTAPFWYWFPIHQHLTRKTHPVSEEEIRSALVVLERRKTFVLPMDLEALLGRSLFEHKSDRFAVSIYERMRKFNETKEKERLQAVNNAAKEIAGGIDAFSKTKAKCLSRDYRRRNQKALKPFKKTQRMFDHLITKYKRRERLKMAKRMEQTQNATLVAGEFNVSPPIVAKWHRRYKHGGAANLDDRSRAPRTFKHKIVFEQQENWIRVLHAEGLELVSIREELKNRYGFEITDGGLYQVLKRLNLILPCSTKNRFVKRNLKKSQAKRHLPQKKVFAEQEQWILDLHYEGLNNSQIKRELANRYEFCVSVGTVRETLLRIRIQPPRELNK